MGGWQDPPVRGQDLAGEHDHVLGRVVRAAAGGHSGIAVLVGGSSVGKTRACWEALQLLRDQEPSWRLWYPIDHPAPMRRCVSWSASGRGPWCG